MAEAAESIGKSEGFVRDRVHAGLLPHVRVGGRVLVLVVDLTAFADRVDGTVGAPRRVEADPLADAWRGRRLLGLGEFSRSLGLSTRAIQRLRKTDLDLPVVVDELGRPGVDAQRGRDWLRARRSLSLEGAHA